MFKKLSSNTKLLFYSSFVTTYQIISNFSFIVEYKLMKFNTTTRF